MQKRSPQRASLQDSQALYQELVIWRYWPNVEGIHVGYANSKRFLLFLMSLFCVALCALCLDFFFHLDLGALVAIALCFLMLSRKYRELTTYNGYYEVDKQGKPVRFLSDYSTWPLETPLGRSMSRKRFLHSVQG